MVAVNFYFCNSVVSLRWRYNGREGVSNRHPRDYLLNRIFRRRSKKTSKPSAGNSPGTGEFPAQMASNAENVSIWWHHHVSMIVNVTPVCFRMNSVVASTFIPLLSVFVTIQNHIVTGDPIRQFCSLNKSESEHAMQWAKSSCPEGWKCNKDFTSISLRAESDITDIPPCAFGGVLQVKVM